MSAIEYFDNFVGNKIGFLLQNIVLQYTMSIIMVISGLILIIKCYMVEEKDLISETHKTNYDLFITIGFILLFVGLLQLLIARSLHIK